MLVKIDKLAGERDQQAALVSGLFWISGFGVDTNFVVMASAAAPWMTSISRPPTGQRAISGQPQSRLPRPQLIQLGAGQLARPSSPTLEARACLPAAVIWDVEPFFIPPPIDPRSACAAGQDRLRTPAVRPAGLL
jgi:hypothetical protein